MCTTSLLIRLHSVRMPQCNPHTQTWVKPPCPCGLPMPHLVSLPTLFWVLTMIQFSAWVLGTLREGAYSKQGAFFLKNNVKGSRTLENVIVVPRSFLTRTTSQAIKQNLKISFIRRDYALTWTY